MRKFALLIALTIFSPLTWADDSPYKIGGIWGMAATNGGDELVEFDIVYEDGDVDGKDVEAGELVYFFGGINLSKNQTPWSSQLTLGYHFGGVLTGSDSVKFTRMPIDLLFTGRFGKHAISTGGTYHLNPKLDISDLGLKNVRFSNAAGAIIQYAYFSNDRSSIGIRYTKIEYEVNERYYTGKFDGSHIGLFLTGYF